MPTTGIAIALKMTVLKKKLCFGSSLRGSRPKSNENGMPINWVSSSAPMRSIVPMPISAP